jgi:PLD-like domain
MTHLVYHNLSEKTNQTSPFDEAVLEVARCGAVDIVSPYIGVDYLFRVIQVSQGWRLITDIEAWLSSLSIRARPKAWLFIRKNLNSIHHCPAIHAKAVIGETRAMFGSANLTNAGILGRTELGILIDDAKMLAELNRWFATLWAQTNSPAVDEASAFIQ